MKTMQNDTQRIIVSQSMLKFVQDYSKQLGVNLKLKELVRITDILSDFCMVGASKTLYEKLELVDKFIEGKFSEL
jgi:hypothetical protein